MSTSVWTGHLNFGLVSIPVRLHPAARSKGIPFNMLHKTDLSRVKQQLICPAENKVIDRGDVVKGFEFRKDEYVVVDPAEIKAVEPKTSTIMEILEFVPLDQVDPVYFDQSYYLAPEEAGKRAFIMLSRAIFLGDYVAVAKVFMHSREYTCIIRGYQGGLILHTMFYQDEVRDTPPLPKFEPDMTEVEMAMKLIVQMSEIWDPGKYFDSFQEDLKKLIETKLEGGSVKKEKIEVKPKPVVDLMAALTASIKQTTKK